MKIKKNKQQKTIYTNTEMIFIIIVTCILSIIFGALLTQKLSKKETKDENLEEFIKTYDEILNNYYKEVDKKELLSGAVNGMLNTLDQFSTLIDSDTNDNFYLTLEGSYDGIGIEITNDDNNNIVIVGVLDDSPSSKAGLKPGDIIKKVDDLDLTNKKFDELSSYIRKNNKKDKYNLLINRDGVEKNYEINKQKVIIKSVSSKIIEKDNHRIGYMYISIFSNDTARQFENELKNLEKEEIDYLIFDVRENTGGHLTTVSSMLNQLMSNKHVIYQIEKNNEKTKYYSNGEKDIKYPIAILQNGNSASGSEMFSISLQENLGAIVVGENSYGKGTVQELNYLSNGDSYKYTTKKWLSPNGIWINEIGVKPDIEVKLNDEYIQNPSDENDNQLQAAINELKKHTID